MNEVDVIWRGDSGGYHIYLNNEQVYFTKDDYEKSMFVAELKAKIKKIESGPINIEYRGSFGQITPFDK